MQDLNDKINNGGATAAGQLDATEWNQVPSEIQNVIEELGITLSGGDLNQLGKAIAGYVANGTFYTDSGAADAYVLSVIGSKQAPTAYTDGMRIRGILGNTNTGASTVNVAALGVKDIKKESATTALAADDLVAGPVYEFIFDLAADAFDVILPGPRPDIISASGTYNKPPGLKFIKATVTAAGGGGGAGGNPAGGRGGGGAGGGTSISYLSAAALGSSETVTIGAGGAGGLGASAAGGNGGASSLGALVTTNGGSGGSGGGASPGGSGGAAGTGDLALGGGDGSDGNNAGGDDHGSGDGGGSFYGTGGRSGSPTGVNAIVVGAGGGGSFNAGQAGNGLAGVIVIEEFF